MSRFGIRKKLKGALKGALGLDGDESAVPAAAPSPSAPRSPAPPGAKAESPRSEPAPPKAPSSPSRGAPPQPPKAALVEEGTGTGWVQAKGVRPDEVVPNTAHSVEIFGTAYALYKTSDGEFFATLGSCPHAGGPLADGELDGFEVTCPFHFKTFDVRDGSCTSGEDMSVEAVAVRVADDMVLLEVGL